MTVAAALNNFVQALVGVGHSLIDAAFAVFQAFLALGNAVLMGGVKVVHAVIVLFTDLVQDTLGLVFANFFLLLALGGGYYLWTNSQRGGGSRAKGKGRISTGS